MQGSLRCMGFSAWRRWCTSGLSGAQGIYPAITTTIQITVHPDAASAARGDRSSNCRAAGSRSCALSAICRVARYCSSAPERRSGRAGGGRRRRRCLGDPTDRDGSPAAQQRWHGCGATHGGGVAEWRRVGAARRPRLPIFRGQRWVVWAEGWACGRLSLADVQPLTWRLPGWAVFTSRAAWRMPATRATPSRHLQPADVPTDSACTPCPPAHTGDNDATVLLKQQSGSRRWQHLAGGSPARGAAARAAADGAAGGAAGAGGADPAAAPAAAAALGRASPVEQNYTVILGSHRNSCLKFEKDGELCCMVSSNGYTAFVEPWCLVRVVQVSRRGSLECPRCTAECQHLCLSSEPITKVPLFPSRNRCPTPPARG